MQRGKAPTRKTATAQRSSAERSFVLLVSGTFAGIVLSLVAMQANTVIERSNSRATMGASLEQVGRHQSSYHVLHGRFATWPELEARGERVAEGVEVVRSSATKSHWYMQLLHRDAGLVCDKLHDLSQELAENPTPEQCREVTTQ